MNKSRGVTPPGLLLFTVFWRGQRGPIQLPAKSPLTSGKNVTAQSDTTQRLAFGVAPALGWNMLGAAPLVLASVVGPVDQQSGELGIN